MIPRRNWNRDELIVAFNLYCKLRFGQYDRKNQKVIDLARVIKRTPSAVAMKLSNFASFDPAHQRRGIKGLGNVSQGDKVIWDEFNSDWNRLGVESERAFQDLLGEHGSDPADDDEAEPTFAGAAVGPTETQRLVDVRLGQSFFRSTVLASYRGHCCICRLSCQALLIASHIVPWAIRPELRLDPRNGLCLCAMHDKAFDRGLIAVDENWHILVSRRFAQHQSNSIVDAMFSAFHDKLIDLPEKFRPAAEHLKYHRANVFRNDGPM